MITLPSLSLLDQGAPRIWLSVEPTDMRRGFDRLAEQARAVMGCDPRSGHPLAQRLLARASTRDLPPAEVTFDLTSTVPTVTALKRFIGSAGDLLVTLFSVESPSQAEDHVIVSAVTDSGEVLPEELARRFFWIRSTGVQQRSQPARAHPVLEQETARIQQSIQRDISERNAKIFEQEADKLDGWADDLKVALERDIKDLDRQIKEPVVPIDEFKVDNGDLPPIYVPAVMRVGLGFIVC